MFEIWVFTVSISYIKVSFVDATCVQLYPPEDEHLRLKTCRVD